MGPATRLHRDDAGWELGARGDRRVATHATSDQNFPGQIKANKAAAVLPEINAEYRDFHGFVPPHECETASLAIASQ
jgi:hypothetical protein